jgi:hypothetical protein
MRLVVIKHVKKNMKNVRETEAIGAMKRQK